MNIDRRDRHRHNHHRLKTYTSCHRSVCMVEQAAEALGLDTKEKNLYSIAEECAQKLGIRF